MLSLLKRLLFGRSRNDELTVEGWWLDSPFTLPQKVTTPLGGHATVVTAAVDITYTIDNGKISIRRVRLSRAPGNNIAATRRGEAWRADSICPESVLVATVEKDLALEDSRLRKVMRGKWYSQNSDGLAQSLVDAINAKEPPEQIARHAAALALGTRIRFSYKNGAGESSQRSVVVEGVSGQSLRGRDKPDGTVKSYRLDRIGDARVG